MNQRFSVFAIVVFSAGIAAATLAFSPPTQNPPGGGSAISIATSTPANTIYLTGAGNVGIGTTGPPSKLSVFGTGQVLIDTESISGWSGIGFQSTFTTGNYALLGNTGGNITLLNRPSGGVIQFRENNANQVTIASGGNVGIGTTTPASALSVVGEIRNTGGVRFNDNTLQTTAYLGGTQTIVANNVSAGTFGSNTGFGNYTFGTSTNPILFIDNTNARVGVGTTAPTQKLQVSGGGIRLDNSQFLLWRNATNSVDINSIFLDANNDLQIGTAANSVQMPVSLKVNQITNRSGTTLSLGPNGNDIVIGNLGPVVGIGNSSPTGLLHVGTNLLYVSSTSGNVGIGTTAPGSALDVRGTITFGNVCCTAINNSQVILNSNTGVTIGNAAGIGDLILQAGGTEKVRIASSGNVGIGTSTPAEKLAVFGSGDTSVRIETTNTASTGASLRLKRNTIGATREWWVGNSEANDNFDIYDNTAGAVRLAIASSGNVGIGTTTPSNKLTVVGTIESTSGGFKFPDGTLQTTAGGGSTISANNVSSGTFGSNTGFGNYTFGTSTNPILFIDNTNARVGIGMTTPNAKLVVTVPAGGGGIPSLLLNNLDTNVPYLQFQSGGLIQDLSGGSLRIRAGGASSFLVLDTSSTERMRIDGTGKVGIGTVNPISLLEMASAEPTLTLTSSVSGNIQYQISSGGNLGFTLGDFVIYDSSRGGTPFRIVKGSSASNNAIVIKDSNVGIGTTGPATKLHIIGDSNILRLQASTAGSAIFHELINSAGSRRGYFGFGGTGSSIMDIVNEENGSMRFFTNNLERVQITSAGNVGIGNASPTGLLHVSSSALYVSSTTGNVGIGTVTPTSKLQVEGGNVQITAGDLNFAQAGTSHITATNATGFLGIGAGGNLNQIYLQPNGNVGIGTANPGAKLDVSGDTANVAMRVRTTDANSALLQFSINNGVGTGFIGMDKGANLLSAGTAGDLVLRTDQANDILFGTNADNTRMIITGSGNVGIGTSSPATLFTVATSTNIFNVLSNGNVGIGTSTPSVQFEVWNSSTATTTVQIGDASSSPVKVGCLKMATASGTWAYITYTGTGAQQISTSGCL